MHEDHQDGRLRRWEVIVALSLIGVGVMLRLVRYLEVLPFRVDELRLVTNVFERSWADLVKPLDYSQSAPMGFLWLQKVFLGLFGDGELSLRAVSLVAGMAFLVLLYVVARRLLHPTAALFILLLAAISPTLILRSTDSKQYSLDALVTLLILLVALPLLQRTTRRRLVTLAVVGAVSLVVSFTSFFVLASVGLVLLIGAVGKRQRSLTVGLLSAGGAWLIVMIVLYFINLRYLHTRQSLADWFAPDFMPLPRSTADLAWYYRAFVDLFKMIGLSHILLPALLLILGVRRYVPRDWPIAAFCILPIVCAAIASALHRYPFEGRLLTYAAPLVYLLIGAGFGAAARAMSQYRWLLGVAVIATISYGLVDQVVRLPEWGAGRYDIVQVLDHAAEHGREDDLVLVAGPLRFPYDYYAPRRGVPAQSHVVELPIAIDDPILNLDRVAIAGRRTWVLIPHSQVIRRAKHGDPRAATLAALDALGERLDRFVGANVTVILYEFRS